MPGTSDDIDPLASQQHKTRVSKHSCFSLYGVGAFSFIFERLGPLYTLFSCHITQYLNLITRILLERDIERSAVFTYIIEEALFDM